VDKIRLSKKRWADQPDEVEQANPMCHFTMRAAGESKSVEIREADGHYYLTIGSIFGSETLRAGKMRDVLRVIDRVASLDEGQVLDLNRFTGVQMLQSVKV